MESIGLTDGRKLSSMIGMPVYCLDHGRRIGSIKDVIYDTEQSRVLAFTMENRGVFTPSRKLLRYQDVKSVGENALMIESEQVILNERSVPQYKQVLQKGAGITGKAVLTESGNYLGRISEILVDDSSGRAVSYELTFGLTKDISTGRSYISTPSVSRVGDDVIIVPDETQTIVEGQVGGLAGTYESMMAQGRGLGQKAGAYAQEQTISAVKGRTAGQDVFDNEGLLIVAKGQLITDPIIDTAVREGKLYDLAKAAGVGGVAGGYEAMRTGVTGAVSQQLKGRVVPRNVTDDQGLVVIPFGTVIDDSVLQLAQERGVMGKLATIVLGESAKTGTGSVWEQTKLRATEAWSGLSERSRESASKAGRRRAVSDQKNFLKGKVSATDIYDDRGNVILSEGEVITPLTLDTLDREGKLEMVRLEPQGQPAVGPVDEGEHAPEIHVVVESAQQHDRHSPKPSM